MLLNLEISALSLFLFLFLSSLALTCIRCTVLELQDDTLTALGFSTDIFIILADSKRGFSAICSNT